ncbi:hypothetical protein [Aquimarina aquimarini]|nr:hypothetical protein [Aquimarina aquimarini]
MFTDDMITQLNEQLDSFFPLQHSSYVFEFRVKEDNEQVDLAIAINKKEGFDFFKQYYQSRFPKIAYLVTQFYQISNSSSNYKGLWFEIDLDGDKNDKTPSIFVSLKQGNCTSNEIERYSTILDFGIEKKSRSKFIAQCIDALKGDAYIAHIGVMHSRKKAKTTRLYINGLELGEIHGFLDECNWPGNKLQAVSLAEEFYDNIKYLSIAIEFNDKMKPTLGIEFHFDSKTVDYQFFVDKMLKKKMCSRKRIEMIEDIIKPDRTSYKGYSYKKSLSHFKINITTKGEIIPKFYVHLIPDYLGVFGF